MNRLIFDQNYSNALICAMYESNKIAFEPTSENEDNMFKHILKEYKRKKIKKNALTYALLYDGIELISPFIDPRNEMILNIHNPQLNDFDIESFNYAMDIREISLTAISRLYDTSLQNDPWFNTYKQLRRTSTPLHYSSSNQHSLSTPVPRCRRSTMPPHRLPPPPCPGVDIKH